MLRHLPIILLLIFILELASLIWLGGLIGVLPVIAITILDVMIGSALLKRSGSNIFAVVQGRGYDAKAVSSGAAGSMLGAIAGILLIIPGLFSDVAAVVLLLPFLHKRLARFFEGHIVRATPGGQGPHQGPVIEADSYEVVEIKQIERPRPAED